MVFLSDQDPASYPTQKPPACSRGESSPTQEIIKRKIIGLKKPFDLHDLLGAIQEKIAS